MLLLVLNLLLCISTQLHADHLVIRKLTDYPLALCNDGSQASYHYTEGDLDNPQMLIYLQGGGACATADGCSNRCKDGDYLCTADTNPAYDKEYTMWSQDPKENPAFHNFGKVFVHYCSSDVWCGTRSASDDTNGYYFHGKHIVEAVVNYIIKHKPNIESMKQMVLIGTSAGAFGVNLNCDFVADKFHAVNPGLDVRCIADAGDFFPTTVHTEGCDPYELTEMTHQFWQGVGDQSCIDETPEGSKECLMFSSYYNFIETPLMTVAHYIDTTVHGPCTPALDEDQDFWDNWQKEAASMAFTFIEVIQFDIYLIFYETIYFFQDKPMNGLFFSNCPFHVSLSIEFAWSDMDVPLVDEEGSVLYKDIIANWLTGQGPYQAMDMPLQKNPKCPY